MINEETSLRDGSRISQRGYRFRGRVISKLCLQRTDGGRACAHQKCKLSVFLVANGRLHLAIRNTISMQALIGSKVYPVISRELESALECSWTFRRTVRSLNHERQSFGSDRDKFEFSYINLWTFACPTGGARRSPKSCFAAKCDRGEVYPSKTRGVIPSAKRFQANFSTLVISVMQCVACRFPRTRFGADFVRG